MGNGVGTGTDSGVGTGTENEVENYFHEDTDADNGSALNRAELMKLTGRQLAPLAQPYSDKSLKTLEKTAKPTLCDLILNKGDKKAQDEKEPTARTGTAKSETETLIATAINMLEMIKRSRDDEPLNPIAKDICTKQLIVYADEKVKSDEMNVDKANNLFLVLSTGALLYDGIIGFKNTPALFSKLKNKFFKSEDKKAKDNDTK